MEQLIVYPPPVLKWAGGKRWLIEELRKFFEPNRRLVDPFVGGMSVPLGLEAKRALISDVNPHVMNLHMHLKTGMVKDEKFNHIEFRHDQDVFYRNRELFNTLADTRQFWTTDGALLFYYLNRSCYNGLCRFNRRGLFNTPFGKYTTVNYETSFLQHRDAMKDWTLMCGDFESLPLDPEDFIYADPPYDVEFTSFAQRDFTWSDQERLAAWLARHKGPAMASNQATARIIELYRRYGFEVYQLPGPRTISSTGDRTPAQEILAVKRPQ